MERTTTVIDHSLSRIEDFIFNLKAKIEDYADSDAFEQDLDEWNNSFKTNFYKEQSFDHIKDREKRLKLKLEQIRNKMLATTAQGGRDGFLTTATTLQPKVIASSMAVFASARLGFSTLEGVKVFLRRLKK